jgi:hypothetical protein
MISANHYESCTLLPNLISGEVRAKDAERFVEAHV